jgi:predicted CoA-binding protein
MNSIDEKIAAFLAAPAFGVAGASKNRDKYGNKVLRCYQLNGRTVVPVNPVEVQSLSIITPPQVTDQVVEQAITRGIRNIWMQPGAQSAAAIAACEQAGINVIADGSCVLVVLGYREH